MMIRAAIYARISQDRDLERVGVGIQEKDCRALAASKGWEVVEVFIENNVSASSTKARPEYQRMVAAIESGEINGIVVWDVDRLTRKIREMEDVIDMADQHSVALASVGGEIDLATVQGRGMARMKGVMAKMEAEGMSRRIKATKAERAALGMPSGGTRRYGYEKEGPVTIVDGHSIKSPPPIIKHEAAIIEEVAGRVLNGDSLRSICIDLTARGELTSTGRSWQSTSMRVLLTGPHVAGLRTHYGKTVTGTWEPILKLETWHAVREVLNPAERRSNASGMARRHTWSGLIVCGLCGSPMRVHRSGTKGRPLWRCAVRDGQGCGRVSARQQEVDARLDEALLLHVEQEPVATDESIGAVAALEAEVQRLEAKREGLVVAFLADDDGGVDFRLASQAVTQRIEQTKAEWRAAVRRTGTVRTLDPTTLRAAWPSMKPHMRRDLAATHVARVVIDPTPVRGRHHFDPERLHVDWVESPA